MTATAQPQNAVWARVCAFMQVQCGVVLEADQAYLLEPRLGPLAKRHALGSVADFVSAACLAPPGHPLQRGMIDAMTTHESSFFRDPTFWQALETLILPALQAAGRRELRVWSAACSFGQEAYSIAMLLDELYPAWAANSQILASDISGEAIERGKRGIYGALEVSRGCHGTRLARHFDAAPAAGGYQVKARLRERIVWRTHNLMQPLEDGAAFDLIFCRNVLIYFTVDKRRSTFDRLMKMAALGGYMGLGNTEQGGGIQVAPGWFACGDRQKDKKV